LVAKKIKYRASVRKKLVRRKAASARVKIRRVSSILLNKEPAMSVGFGDS
jgi:hypothetical protein